MVDPFLISKKIKMFPRAGIVWLIHTTRSKWIIRLLNKWTQSNRRKVRAFAKYEPGKHDVIVATFGRSGTNWTLQIAYQIAHLGEGTFRHINEVVPWPESFNSNIARLYNTSYRRTSPTVLRIIKTHLEKEYVPYSEHVKYITVFRDPKEVFVSSYFFRGKGFTVEEWLELFFSGGLTNGLNWARHTAGYWAWRNRPNVLLLTFNEMKRDLQEAVLRIADLMGVDLAPEQVEKVLKKSSFNYMKKNNHKFSSPKLSFFKKYHGVIVRRGRSGETSELLDDEQKSRIDRYCRERLRQLGSDFPYNELFG
ncbi:sulfotransferase domain-containing protein [Thermodesulfobacteriota bacterium]